MAKVAVPGGDNGRAGLVRLQAGNLADCNPLRDGVQELRIDHGPAYRVYLSRQGAVLVLLLCGSDRATKAAPSGSRSGIWTTGSKGVSHEPARPPERRNTAMRSVEVV